MTCVHSHRQVLWWYGTAYAIVLWSIAAATGEWVYPNMDWSDPYSLVAYVLLPVLPFIAFLLWCAAPLRAHPRAPGSSGARRPCAATPARLAARACCSGPQLRVKVSVCAATDKAQDRPPEGRPPGPAGAAARGAPRRAARPCARPPARAARASVRGQPCGLGVISLFSLACL